MATAWIPPSVDAYASPNELLGMGTLRTSGPWRIFHCDVPQTTVWPQIPRRRTPLSPAHTDSTADARSLVFGGNDDSIQGEVLVYGFMGNGDAQVLNGLRFLVIR